MRNVGLFLCLLISAQLVFAQNPLGENARDTAIRNQSLMRSENGLVAPNLERLVVSSVAIVRGYYGDLLETYVDYGEGRTLDDVIRETGLPEQNARFLGFPMAKYQFKITHILKDSG